MGSETIHLIFQIESVRVRFMDNNNENKLVIQLPESSMLRSLEFSPTTKTLRATFNTGGVYEYDNITWSVMESLCESPSLGRAFHSIIMSSRSKHPFTKIS